MAAKKSIPRMPATHAGLTQVSKHQRDSVRQKRSRSPSKRPTRSMTRAILADADKPVRDRDDLIERLSDSLSLVETVAMALKAFEGNPALASVWTALDHAVTTVDRAHMQVEHFLSRKSS